MARGRIQVMARRFRTPSLGKGLVIRLSVRVFVNAMALYLADAFLDAVSFGEGISPVLLSALLLALVNAILKPILVILSLPILFLTFGLFSLVVNAVLVALVAWLVGDFSIGSFWGAVLAGFMVSLLNYMVTTYLEDRIFKE